MFVRCYTVEFLNAWTDTFDSTSRHRPACASVNLPDLDPVRTMTSWAVDLGKRGVVCESRNTRRTFYSSGGIESQGPLEVGYMFLLVYWYSLVIVYSLVTYTEKYRTAYLSTCSASFTMARGPTQQELY